MDKKTQQDKKGKKKPHFKFPKQQYKEKIKKQKAQYREKYMQQMSKELNPSSRTIQDIFALDDEEVKHRQYLEANYRDRAKERRQQGNYGDLLQKGDSDIEDENIEMAEKETEQTSEQQQEIKKGLDMQMYLLEMEQLEKSENKLKKIKQNESLKQIQQQQQPQKRKGLLASAIERQIISNKQLKNSNLFNPNIHYEYEIDDIFDVSIPKSIVKKSKKINEEDPKIMMKINGKLLKRTQEFVEAVASGRPIKKKYQMKTMEIENSQQNNTQKDLQENQYSDSDNIFSENEDKQFEKIKPSLSLFPTEPELPFAPKNPQQFSIFQNLTSNPKYQHENEPETTEINNETENQINQIQKNILGQSKSRLEEKLELLNSDQYMECYPAMDPSLSELKQAGGLAANYQFKRFGPKGNKKGKEHKVDKVKEHSKFQKVNQIMKDKQKK